MDAREYIDEYKNFRHSEPHELANYVRKKLMDGVATIKITRWNEKGERA